MEEISTLTMTSKKRQAFDFVQKEEDKKELKELFQGDSDSEDDLLVRAERRQERRDAGEKVLALVPAGMDDDSEELSDEDGDDEEDEEGELLDAETFKEQKTEVFREMANVKDIVEDFDLSEEDTETEKKKKKTMKTKTSVVKKKTSKLMKTKGGVKQRKKQKVAK